MIELRDTVTIDVPPEAVWAWLRTLPEHYLEWHPDHVGAGWVRGTSFEPGSVLEAQEILHGKTHRLRMTTTDVEPGRRVRYRFFPGVTGELVVKPIAGQSTFTAVIRMGVRTPVVGAFLDRLLRLTLGRRITAIARHQVEEGRNLKALLEAAER